MQSKQNLAPAFDFAQPNQSVFLAEDNVVIEVDGKSYVGKGQAVLELVPKARIHIYSKLKGVPLDVTMDCLFGQRKISHFQFGNVNIDGTLVGGGGSTSQDTANLKWRPKHETIVYKGDDSTEISSVVFHLFNFRYIESVAELYGLDWRVTLHPLENLRGIFDELKSKGGYALTHVGSFEKIDGASFSGEEALEFIIALDLFFSFAKGVRCNPVCAVGYDELGNRVWETWSSPREPWHIPLSWFDPHNSTQLVALFAGFMKRWENENWRGALHEVIYWYLNANHPSRGIDAGIILTQAAIERLSYEVAVKDRRLLTAKGFKDIWASDKFRLLFSSLGLPLDIPPETPELQMLASNSQMNWLDTPHALTEIRNSLVHPEHKHHGQFGNAYYEAWNLGLWYLEMSILAVCGYSGTYRNRLDLPLMAGKVENVPWSE